MWPVLESQSAQYISLLSESADPSRKGQEISNTEVILGFLFPPQSWHHTSSLPWYLFTAFLSTHVACGIWTLCPLRWKHRVLTTGQLEFPSSAFNKCLSPAFLTRKRAETIQLSPLFLEGRTLGSAFKATIKPMLELCWLSVIKNLPCNARMIWSLVREIRAYMPWSN